MEFFKTLNLQLFADGAGDGGDGGSAQGSESGENAAVAEQPDEKQRLLELNVPRDKVERWAKRKAERERRNGVAARAPQKQAPVATVESTSAENPEEAQPAQEQPQEQEKPTKPSFEELMKDPEYNKAMQETVKARLKQAKGAEDFVNQIVPALAKKYGLEGQNADLAAIANAVNQEVTSKQDEEAAASMGISAEAFKRIREANQQEQETIQDKRLREHAERVVREAEALKQVIPGFDLMAERQNSEVFRRMVDNPDNPVPLEVAYKAVHHNDLVNTAVQEAIRQAQQKAASAVQSGSRRPSEAGTT